MEQEASLPCSQESFPGPYSRPDQSNPYNPLTFPPSLHPCYMLGQSHPPWLGHSNDLGEEQELWSSSLCSLFQSPITSSLFRPSDLLRHHAPHLTWETKFSTYTEPTSQKHVEKLACTHNPEWLHLHCNSWANRVYNNVKTKYMWDLEQARFSPDPTSSWAAKPLTAPQNEQTFPCSRKEQGTSPQLMSGKVKALQK
jgi:hypothetical protein